MRNAIQFAIFLCLFPAISCRQAVQAVEPTDEVVDRVTFLKCIVDNQTCHIMNQEVDDNEINYTIAPENGLTIEALKFFPNKKVKFLPENVVATFPKLIEYEVFDCAVGNVSENNLGDLRDLVTLNLAGNEIVKIARDSFKDLRKLKSLNLYGNRLTSLDPKTFRFLKNLRELVLISNEIESLDENIFENSANLQSIRLGDNKLKTISARLFRNNLHLKEILLERNQIEVISFTMFNHLAELEEVDLIGNVCVNRKYKNILKMWQVEFKYKTLEISEMQNDLQETNCTNVQTENTE